MGSGGPPGSSEVQNLFKISPQQFAPSFSSSPFPPPNHPFIPGSHPFPPSNFLPSTSYHSSTAAAFPPLPGTYSQESMYPSYTHYPQGLAPRPPYPNPSGFLQASSTSPSLNLVQSTPPQSSFPQLSPLSTPPLDGGARLMAMLTTHMSTEVPGKEDSSVVTPPLELPPPANLPNVPSVRPVNLAPTVSNRLSGKLPKGRYLKGEHVVYDIDKHLPGEAQPQLEVSPITVYTSDPVLVVGRQIAVNRSYICYRLRAGTIRILNINTAIRTLLRGHSQRVTDMAFFAEDVHLLASASSDGCVFVRRIVENPGEDGKMQIMEQVLLAIQFFGSWESIHPRVCWYPHTQDLLVVSVGKHVLLIDMPKVRLACALGGTSIEDPVKCHVDNPIDGVQCVGGHEADITDLSSCQLRCLASASKDGMVKIWGEKKMIPISSFSPHDGQSIESVSLLLPPNNSDQIAIATTGALNRELKLWVPTSPEGCFSQASSVKWQCVQTLELTSSGEGKVEDAFFNQLLVVPQANLILLANAKRNAIYVVHIEHGANLLSTRMDYLAEFSVKMSILSFTATSENVSDGEGIVRVYCVQTQAIQQYSLELLQCLPPPLEESFDLLNQVHSSSSASSSIGSDSSSSFEPPSTSMYETSRVQARSPAPLPDKVLVGMSAQVSTHGDHHFSSANTEASEPTSLSKEVKESTRKENTPAVLVTEQTIPSAPLVSPQNSPTSSRRPKSGTDTSSASTSSPQKNQAEKVQMREVSDKKIDHPTSDNISEDPIPLSPRKIAGEEDDREWRRLQVGPSPTHLLTPSELMSIVARSKAEADGGGNSTSPQDIMRGDTKSSEHNDDGDIISVETKEVAESFGNMSESGSTGKEIISESCVRHGWYIKEKHQTESQKTELAREESQNVHDIHVSEGASSEKIEESEEQQKEVSVKTMESPSVSIASQSSASAKGRKNKNKNNAVGSSAVALLSAPSSSSSTAIIPPENELNSGSNLNAISSTQGAGLAVQLYAMQDALNQLVTMQKELQKQMTVMVAVPVAKEGKRMEAVLGQRIEKVLKVHVDAMWARIQEENIKREKAERERIQQWTTLLSNLLSKDLPAAIERALKKEISVMGLNIAKLVTPSIEKAVVTTVNDAFQKEIIEKGMQQLEKSVGSKLEAAVVRNLLVSFQTTGRQSIQESLRACFEGSVIPAFEHSCRAMFEQVDAAFQKGILEHVTHAHQQFSSHSGLASTLQETLASATSLATSMRGELADGQRKLLALAESAGSCVSYINKPNNGGLPDKAPVTLRSLEESLDPTIELSRLVGERKLEEAFNKALTLSDVATVSWLCTQVDPMQLTTVPPPLSQGVLLSLVQQLGCELGKDTVRKLTWIKYAALALNPNDPLLAPHMRPILEHLYQNLLYSMRVMSNPSGEVANSLRLIMHLINSLRASCN